MNAFTKYESVHVRWPGQTSGAFGLALIFLVLFASRQKERKIKKQIYLYSFFCLCKRKNQRKAHRQWYTAIAGRPDL